MYWSVLVVVIYIFQAYVYGFLQWPKQLNAPLEVVDPEIANIIELEKARQWKVTLTHLVSNLRMNFFFVEDC